MRGASRLSKVRPVWLAGLLLATAVGLAGVGSGGQKVGKNAELGSELAKAPDSASARPNPYEERPEAVLAGRKLYRQHCAECHGADGSGGEKAPDLHSEEIRKASAGRLFWFLKNGDLDAGMPAWSKLPDQRLWQLVSYLKTIQ